MGIIGRGLRLVGGHRRAEQSHTYNRVTCLTVECYWEMIPSFPWAFWILVVQDLSKAQKAATFTSLARGIPKIAPQRRNEQPWEPKDALGEPMLFWGGATVPSQYHGR